VHKKAHGRLSKTAKLALILSLCAAAVLAVTVFAVIPFVRYNMAVTLMGDGAYAEAKEAFTGLGDFKDAAALAVECQNMEDYAAAANLMDAGQYEEAKAAFHALAPYRDSGARALECQYILDYDTATEALADGNYAQAQDLFVKLGSYKDSVALAEECGNNLAYAQAVALMEAGSFTDAAAALEPLAAQGFADSAGLLAECGLNIDYAAADAAFWEGRFYTAFKLFTALADFQDSSVRAEQCEQDYPFTGELYRNGDFSGTSVTLEVLPPGDDPRPTLLKIYTPDSVLVSVMFIRGGQSPSIQLPANLYMIKAAYGERWYGLEEMFGDEDAVYEMLLLEGDPVYNFEANYDYTLTLRSDENGNVETSNENRERF
jgi:tetratricopeptide (TPR) repeat protein